MKPTLLSLILLLGLSFQAFAQQRNELKGPAAKNYKYYKSDKKDGQIILKTTPPRVAVGPVSKNHRIKAKPMVGRDTLALAPTHKAGLKGPAFKNSARKKQKDRPFAKNKE